MPRSSAKRRAILHELRRSIAGGRFPPGARLPTRAEMVEQFGASSTAVQQAMDALAADGFLCARGPLGTFVAERPPHLTRYALALPTAPCAGPPIRYRFYDSLARAAAALRGSGNKDVQSFHQIDGHTDCEDFQLLSRLVREHRVAGVVFAFPPDHLGQTALLDEEGIPRVAIMYGKPPRPLMSGIHLDFSAFFRRAVELLASRGRRRLALITAHPQAWSKELNDELLTAHRLSRRPYWTQTLSLDTPHAARNCAHLLLHRDQKARPDALIVDNDHLAEHALAGLADAGVRVGEDLDVVSHWNFAFPTPEAPLVHWLGFDSVEVLTLGIDLIDRWRRKETPPLSVSVTPVFKPEWLARMDRREAAVLY